MPRTSWWWLLPIYASHLFRKSTVDRNCSIEAQIGSRFSKLAQSMPPATRSHPELIEGLQLAHAKISDICSISGVAGCAVSIIHHGETIHRDNFGYRNLATSEPVTSDAIFHTASLTKSFTGACIHLLKAEGRLSLEDLILKHLPTAKSRDSVVAATGTIADLLGHRTGLQKADNIWLGAEGEVLIRKEDTAAVFRHFRPQAGIRQEFHYNNICYALLGEIIERVSGQSYATFLKERILDPLGMTRTLISSPEDAVGNVSSAYSTLDTGEPWQVTRPQISASTAMGSAGGLMSTMNDLEKYYKALLRAWTNEQALHGTNAAGAVTGNDDALFENVVPDIFAPLQSMDKTSRGEKSYASGWIQSHFPGRVGDIGVNPSLVDKMPVLAAGTSPRLALWHQGSLVGATSFAMLLPETQSAVIVLSNTMALNDAADWIRQMLVETLLGCPSRNDYVRLAGESAERALGKYAEISDRIEEGKRAGGLDRSLDEYFGSYVGFGGVVRVEIGRCEGGLEMRLQGRESQRCHLQHHHGDTFTWFMTWNEQVDKARFVGFQPAVYFVHFRREGEKGVAELRWVYDANMPDGEAFTRS